MKDDRTGQDVAGVSDAELAALASAQIADTGYRLDHIEPGDRDHVARAVMVKPGHDDPIRSPLFRLDTEPLLCLAQRLAREVCALRGMLAARAPERDASRPPPADEDTRPRLTGRDADDIELARAIRDTLREVTHAGAIERLEELLDVEKEAAVRPGLTEEQAQIARAEPIIAAWLAYFAAMDRQHESGSAEDARVVRDLRAKAEAMYRGGPDIVYFVALARHRASQGEAGAMFSPSPVRWKNGKLASRGETGPAAVAINDEERPDEEFGRVWRAQRSAQQARAAAQRPSTLPDLGPAPYRTTMATATTADEELRVTAASLRITVTDLGSVAHDPRATSHDGDPQKSGTLAGGGTGND